MKQTLIILLLMLSFLSGCIIPTSPDCTQKTYIADIPQDDIDNIPYSGKDTLRFINKNTAEIVTFIGSGIDTGYNLGSFNDNYDCPSNPVKLGYRNYKFESNSPNNIIELQMYNQQRFSCKLLFKFKSQNYSADISELGFGYDFQSKIIENKTYYNIDLIGHESNTSDTSYYLLFNKEFGILQFKFPDNTYWNLIEKK